MTATTPNREGGDRAEAARAGDREEAARAHMASIGGASARGGPGSTRGGPGSTRNSTSDSTSGKPPAGSGVLDKLMAVLDLFTVAQPQRTVTELSRALGLPFPTVHRLLAGLERHRLVERAAGSGYRLGPGAIELGHRAYLALDLRALSAPALRWLHLETDETCSVNTVDRRLLGTRCVASLRGSYPFRLYADVESSSPLHAGSAGKALLALAGEDVLDRVARRELEKCARNTVTSMDELRRDLAVIRADGFAFDEQELIDGAWGMAAPIRRPDGAVAASIGFIAPIVRLDAELRRRGSDMVRTAARMVQKAMSDGVERREDGN